MKSNHTLNVFLNPPIGTASNIKVRRWAPLLAGSLFVFVAAYAMAFAVLFKVGHRMGLADPGDSLTLAQHLGYQVKLVLHALMGAFHDTATVYADALKDSPWSQIKGRMALALIPSLFLAFIVARGFYRPITGTRHIDGPKLNEADNPNAVKTAVMTASRHLNAGETSWLNVHPWVGLSKRQITAHTLIFGGAGSGKTTVLWPILAQITANRWPALIYDVKGDFSKALPLIAHAQNVPSTDLVIVSPFCDQDVIPDIGKDVTSTQDAREFAALIIPEDPKDPLWSKGSRQLLEAIVISLQADMGTEWDWYELGQRCLAGFDAKRQWVQAHVPIAADNFADPESKTTQSFLMVFASFVTDLVTLGNAWGDTKAKRVSIREWVRNADNPDYPGPRQIIVRGRPAYEGLTKAYLRMVVETTTRTMLDLPDDEEGRTLFLVLDEFASLGKMDIIKRALQEGRSKGLCAILLFQAIEQLESNYSREDAMVLMANAATKIVCKLSPEAAPRIAETIGKRKVQRVEQSTSSSGPSTSFREHEEHAILPHTLTTLGRVQDGVKALIRLGADLFILTFPFPRLPKVPRGQGYEDADWLKPLWERSPPGIDLANVPPQPERPSSRSKKGSGGSGGGVALKPKLPTPAEAAEAEWQRQQALKADKAQTLSRDEAQALGFTEDMEAAEPGEGTDQAVDTLLHSVAAPLAIAATLATALDDGQQRPTKAAVLAAKRKRLDNPELERTTT